MTGLLWMFSFIMHIVLLFIVYKLFQQLQVLKQSNNQEMKDLLDTFLKEMKEENQQLQRQVNEIQSQSDTSTVSGGMKEEPTDHPLSSEPPVEEKYDDFSPSIQGQVYQLYDQGLSIEDIAKRLDRGKTEVELMIKFKKNLS